MPEESRSLHHTDHPHAKRSPPIWRNEIAGAVVGGLVSFSIAVPVGTLTLAPLGAGFSGIGVAAGLIAATVGGGIAALLGSTQALRSGPMTAVALVVNALLAHLVPQLASHSAYGPILALALASLCVMLAGILQIALGWLKLGQAIKYVPRPVVAGFRLGVALVIATTQWPAFVGASRTALLDGSWPQDFSLAVGAATVLVILLTRRIGMASIALFVGLVMGTLLHHGIAATVDGASVGPTMRPIPPLSDIPFMWAWLGSTDFATIALQQLSSIVVSAVSVALVASLLSLLAAKVIEDFAGERAHGNRELVAQGVANLATGALGGTPVSGSPAASMASFNAHARTRWSALLTSLLLGAVLLFAGPATRVLPFAAVAAVMLVIAWDMLDAELLRYARNALSARTRTADDVVDVGIAVAVAATSVAFNVVAAVGLGVLISVAVFAVKSSSRVVRRETSGSHRRSGRQRNAADSAWLAQHGDDIKLLELEGPIFFGTADNLAVQVESRAACAQFVILDFARVNAVDATAAHTIGHIAQKLAKDGRRLLITSLPAGDRRRITLERATGVRAVEWPPDIDRGLEWCEDRLLERRPTTQPEELSFAQFDICRGLSDREVQALHRAMSRERHAAGTTLFRESEPGDCMYVLAKGSVTIAVRQGASAGKRIVTFAPGVVFGEMALIDGSPRSADATFDVESTVYSLSRQAFDRLASSDPALATKLYAALAVTLTMRLRRTTQEPRLLAAH